MCLVFLQTASIWPPSLGRQHKALRRCRLLLHRKWSEWARTSNNSLNECTAQEPYIKTVNVSTLWSCGEPARLHLSAALCGCCPPPSFFCSHCSSHGAAELGVFSLPLIVREMPSVIAWITLPWQPCCRSTGGCRGASHREGCVWGGEDHMCVHPHPISHTVSVSHVCFLCFLSSIFNTCIFPPFLPLFLTPPLLTHTFIICTVMSSSSSFLLIHPFLSLTLCTHTRPHLIAFSLSPLGHTGEARVAASISHWRHKLSPWQQPKVAAACWSFRNPSLCFLYGSVNTCKSFKPYNPCLSLSASLMFLCKDCYLVHRDHSQFKLGTSYRRNIRQVDDRKHKVASPNRYFFMLKAR